VSTQRVRKKAAAASADGSVPAPQTPDEAARQAELDAYMVLDTPAEARFDRITALAARLFSAPTALISLVDRSRQWFKSRVGLDMRETPRDWSFCAHAISSDAPGPMVVLDALEDERFAENPLVVGEPHIRFYAGAPILSRGGRKLGTLCILDPTPREAFPAEDARLLADLAAVAGDLLEFARSDAERDLLVRELSHRMKNLLSVVQSMADLSARNHPNAQGFVASFRERLLALAAAHDILIARNWRSASLKSLVEAAVGSHAGQAGRIRIDLPRGSVDPHTAQTLALVFHELMTNAAKYGALSAPGGQVSIVGRKAVREGRPIADIEWREEGGPPVEEPTARGFGLIMMEIAAQQQNGGASFEWARQGFVCRLSVPLSEPARAPAAKAATPL
jgi:two-component sensor histidine kinase